MSGWTAATYLAAAGVGMSAINMLSGAGGKEAAPAPAPVVAAPTPMATPPELDPKQKAMQEQSILMGGGNTQLSRSGTILGGSGTLG